MLANYWEWPSSTAYRYSYLSDTLSKLGLASMEETCNADHYSVGKFPNYMSLRATKCPPVTLVVCQQKLQKLENKKGCWESQSAFIAVKREVEH